MIIYIFAFVLACGALLTFGTLPNLSESLRRSAFYLVILAGLVHTFGLVFRMVLEGRPPVTNLYSSAIFIGWGADGAGAGPGTDLPRGHRQHRGRAGRLRHPDDRPQPRPGRRHDGDAARRAGHQLLAGHPRRGGHPGLRLDLRRGPAGDPLHLPRRVHAAAAHAARPAAQRRLAEASALRPARTPRRGHSQPTAAAKGSANKGDSMPSARP